MISRAEPDVQRLELLGSVWLVQFRPGDLRVPPDTWARVIVASSGLGRAEWALSMSLDTEIVKHGAVCDIDTQVWIRQSHETSAR